jgi:hypothetical protein
VQSSARRMPRGFPVLELAPLAHGAQGEDGHHGHADRRDHGADEDAETFRDGAVAIALDRDQGIADEAAGESAEQDADEGDRPSEW